MEIKTNYSLKSLNTFHVEASAKLFAEVNSKDQLIETLTYAGDNNENFLVLGGGSNILLTSDFDGLVIKICIPGIEFEEKEKSVFVRAGAGINWDDLVQSAVDRNYIGIENLSLIPGTVGAAPIQNIGAYGVELKDCFFSLDGIFVDTLEEKTFYEADCDFGYRDSIFKRELKNRFIITSVNLKLSKKAEFNLTYKSLRDSLKELSNEQLNVGIIRENVINIRRSKLPDPEKLGNAGSFFKNPIVTIDKCNEMLKTFPDMPSNKLNEKKIKLYAGWLVEKAGYKGKRKGNVGSYDKQALVIVNYGGARGEDVLKFSREIQKKVLSKFGIELIYEVNIL